MTHSLSPDQVTQLLHEVGTDAIVHLVGAGGCGMSGLGHLLLDLGLQVTGSDLLANEEVRQLQARGARLRVGHAAEHVDRQTRLVVYSSAIRPDNIELQLARQMGIPIVRRAVLLASLLHRQRGICVAGMHGKTTTTALLAFALEELGQRPSYAVGALVPQLVPHARFTTHGPSATAATQPFFAIEADESDGTLGQFHPLHALVLNVDVEHLDHFVNLAAIVLEFQQFAQQTHERLIFCADDPRLAELFARRPGAISYGRHPLAVYRAELLSPKPHRHDSGAPSSANADLHPFQVWHKGELLGSFAIHLLGEQNISNATAVIALLHELGFAPADIARAIFPFQGAARRQQELYHGPNCRIFEDYGHHPNEIRATLRALKTLGPTRLLVAFQPHRFTRTQHLWREFSLCLLEADRLWLADLYPASENEIPGISSGFLANAIQAQGKPVEAVVSLAKLAGIMRDAIQPGDMVLFLGAGDITLAAHQLADELRLAQGNGSPVPGAGLATTTLHAQPMNADLHSQLAACLSPETVLRCHEPLAKRTTLRVGGTADLYAEPASESDLAKLLVFCAEHAVPLVFLGRGSNLLIRDGGVRGLVLCLAHPSFSQIRVERERLHCGAGAKLKAVAVEARRYSLSGMEFLEGIPGCVGGAMRMNAGAMGAWLFDVVESVRFMDLGGNVHERRASEVDVEYRGCPLFKQNLALEAILRGRPAPQEAIQAKMEAFSKKRWESQPSQPSAGCIFKNPKTIPAGRLIDELGLKGTRVGGAVVSEVHGNFIVNDGSATARDILTLIDMIKERARAARAIELETEVQILGEG